MPPVRGFAYRLPEEVDDEHAAPLPCAGIIGYRALRRAHLPPGGRLGIRASTVAYAMERVDAALSDLAHDRVTGAAVLVGWQGGRRQVPTL